MTQSPCPACPPKPELNVVPEPDARLILSLPGIHCGGCIAGVERALANHPGVHEARVNLTLKRVSVDAGGQVTAADLIATLDAAGYAAQELDPELITAQSTDPTGRDLLMRLAVAFFAMMNVMLLSVAVWSGAEGATRDLMHWISAAIAIPAVIFAGRPFYVSAWGALRARRLNMDVPITLAILLAIGTSLSETMLSGAHAYFDAAVALCCFLLAGRYLDHTTRRRARSAAAELAAREVPRALRLGPDGPQIVPVAELAIGDRLRILPGTRVPADGIIRQGSSEIDRALMTGESLPVAVAEGATLRAGEDNLTGPLELEVTAIGPDTELARVTELVAVAEAGKGRAVALADKAAALYAPGVHIMAALAALGWWIATQDMRVSLNIAAAVLIITCPCALGLAVPAVATAASARLFREGLLVKDGTALERLAEVDTVVFDKTGTLTEGTPEVVALGFMDRSEKPVALALAEASAHPLAQSLARDLRANGVTPGTVTDIREVPGQGVCGHWQGQEVRLGRADWIGGGKPEGTTTSFRIGTGPTRIIQFEDRLCAGAAEMVAELRGQGYRVMLLSGDAAGPTRDTAARLGITEVFAGQRPEDKAARMASLADEGAKVLMVGDGLNDTAALAAAHVSIAPASGLDAARAAADIVLLGDAQEARSGAIPVAIPKAIPVAIRARRRISENFGLATAYNLIAVPLAIAGLATPLIAALAMSLSSLTVSLNATRLGPR